MQSNLTASVDSRPMLAGHEKTSRARRRLPAPAFVVLVGLATYVTVGAVLLVPDRGDDFRRFYLSSTTWALGGNPYAVMVDKTGNLNHPLLLPLFWLYT